jgi:DNA-binding response OmpR family regulator
MMTTIHIIENDPQLCDEYSNVLKSAGFQVEINRFGSMAMIVLPRLLPDIVILDMQLPGVPSSLILAYIQSYPNLQNSRIVLIGGDENTVQYRKPDVHLRKPVTPLQLFQAVSELTAPIN